MLAGTELNYRRQVGRSVNAPAKRLEDCDAKHLNHGSQSRARTEFARQYLADGWQVYATYRDPASASELRRLAEVGDGKLQILQLDVTDLASVAAAAEGLKKEAVDLLLNNAGVGGARGQSVGNRRP